MHISQFEDILAWQKAQELTLLVYQKFKETRIYLRRFQQAYDTSRQISRLLAGFIKSL